MEKDKIIIGISGKMQSGKDTVGRLIKMFLSTNPEEFTRDKEDHIKIYKFAESIKESLAVTWGIPLEIMFHDKIKEEMSPLGVTWRALMKIHAEKMLEIDPDYFVLSLFNKIENENNKVCVITDVRYVNEAKKIKDLGGILIRVNTSRIEHTDTDESEVNLDDYTEFDYLINNDSSRWDLAGKVNVMLNEMNLTYKNIW